MTKDRYKNQKSEKGTKKFRVYTCVGSLITAITLHTSWPNYVWRYNTLDLAHCLLSKVYGAYFANFKLFSKLPQTAEDRIVPKATGADIRRSKYARDTNPSLSNIASRLAVSPAVGRSSDMGTSSTLCHCCVPNRSITLTHAQFDPVSANQISRTCLMPPKFSSYNILSTKFTD